MKKTAMAIALILALLFSPIIQAGHIGWVAANPEPYSSSGTSYVNVSILSPENKTYDTNNIQFTIDAEGYPEVSLLEYSLDGRRFVPFLSWPSYTANFSGTLWLNRLSKGAHSIICQATALANNTEVELTACAQVSFTITSALELELEIMSFEEAIQAAEEFDLNESYADYINPALMWGDGTHIWSYGHAENIIFENASSTSGYLLWIAPDRTHYEAEYPAGNVLGALDSRIGPNPPLFDPPEGYYVWDVNSDLGEFWVLASNGTVLMHNWPPPSGHGPTAPPDQTYDFIYVSTAVTLAIAIGMALIFYFKKRHGDKNP